LHRKKTTSDYACQYKEANSPIHRLGAGWKLLIGTLISIITISSREPWQFAAVLALNLLYYFLASLTLYDLWRDIKYFFIQVIIVVWLYSLRFEMPAALWPALRSSLTVILMFIPAIVFLRTTRVSEMMQSLRKIIPYRLSFLIFTSMRFLPLFARELREISMAQRLRGAKLSARDLTNPGNWSDLFHCLMIPLMVRAFKTAEEAALSAEARAFGLKKERTYFDTALYIKENNQ